MRGRSEKGIGVVEGLQHRNWEGGTTRRMNLSCGVADPVSLAGKKEPGRRAEYEVLSE